MQLPEVHAAKVEKKLLKKSAEGFLKNALWKSGDKAHLQTIHYQKIRKRSRTYRENNTDLPARDFHENDGRSYESRPNHGRIQNRMFLPIQKKKNL
jgi:hypothetical protein